MKEISDFVLFYTQNAAQCSAIPSSGSRFQRAAVQFLLPSNPSATDSLRNRGKGSQDTGRKGKVKEGSGCRGE